VLRLALHTHTHTKKKKIIESWIDERRPCHAMRCDASKER
jgi:hypothetical protein